MKQQPKRKARSKVAEVPSAVNLRIAIFADGAKIDDIARLSPLPYIKGFTTNPTLMREAGVKDYETFAKKLIASVTDRPISFEVFSDEFSEMKRQALKISSWGKNVHVKIPITNTRGESAGPLIHELSKEGVKVNVTAIMTLEQVHLAVQQLAGATDAIVSIFAGRIADTGRDPVPVMKLAQAIAQETNNVQTLWASCREILNIIQAERAGTDIITVPPSLLEKIDRFGMNLKQLSLATVQMFYDDAHKAGYSL